MIKVQPWLIYALLSAFFAALTAVFAKAGLKNVHADLATAIRTAVILLITWGIVVFKDLAKEIPAISVNNWVFLVLSAIATGLSWLFYYRALQLGKASEVSAIDKGSIVFTILLAFVFLKEPLSLKLVTGAGLILAGMMVLVWK
ncbi:MAG TPA: EamA family transporter [Puia sp.]|nr:EamA family transporter [Puia sp.]